MRLGHPASLGLPLRLALALARRMARGALLGLVALGASGSGAGTSTTVTSAAGAGIAAAGYVHEATWQSDPTPPLGVIVDPVRIWRASDDSLLVTDRQLHRVQRFTSDGEPIASYGRRGDGDGEVSFPRGAAADLERRRVYVADYENNRLAVFEIDGRFVANWQPMDKPEAVAVAANGNVFVYGPRGKVTVYDPEGEKLSEVVAASPRLDEAVAVGGMSVGPSGLVYVAVDGGAVRVSADGESKGLVTMISNQGVEGRDVAVDAGGSVYVLDRSSRLTRGLPGGLVRQEVLGGQVLSIAGGPRRRMYKATAATRDRRATIATVEFGTNRRDTRLWGDPLTILGWMALPLRLTAGGADELYMVDELYRVQRFTPDGTALGQFSLPGLKEADAAANGDLFVARERFGTSDEDPDDPEVPPFGTHRLLVERYHFDGGFVSSRDKPTAGTRLWSDSWVEPSGEAVLTRFSTLEFDPTADVLYALDAGRGKVRRYTGSGRGLPAIELPDLKSGFPGYTDLAVGSGGGLFVLHTAARQVLRFDAAGAAQGSLDTPEWAWRLDITPDGRLAVATATRWVWLLDTTGGVASAFALPVSAFDEGEPPSDVAVRADGRLYVTDRSGAAVFVFAPGEAAGERPPAGSLGCRLTGAARAPREVPVGEAGTVVIGLGGECDPHRRSGRRPAVVARTTVVTVTLAPGVEVVPGSLEPPGTVAGGRLLWRLDQVPDGGLDLRFDVSPSAPGRTAAFESARWDYLDGWFNYGALSVPRTFFAARGTAPTPTPVAGGRLLLPALGTEVGQVRQERLPSQDLGQEALGAFVGGSFEELVRRRLLH